MHEPHSWYQTTLGPAWRVLLAQRQPAKARRGVAGRDPLVQQLIEYLALAARGPHGSSLAAHRFPDIQAALDLNENVSLAAELKVLVIAKAPLEAISDKSALSEDVIALWERICFDVRDRANSAWLIQHVIEPERIHGDSAVAARMRLALILGAEAVMAGPVADGELVSAAEKLHSMEIAICLKAQEALQALSPMTHQQRLAICKLVMRHHADLHRLALAKERLAERFRCRREKHELQQIRAAERLERARNAGLKLDLQAKRREAIGQRNRPDSQEPHRRPMTPAEQAALEAFWSRPSDPKVLKTLLAAGPRREQALEQPCEAAAALTGEEKREALGQQGNRPDSQGPHRRPMTPSEQAELEAFWSRPSDPKVLKTLLAAGRRPEQALGQPREAAAALTGEEKEETGASPLCQPSLLANAGCHASAASTPRCSHV